MPKDQIEAKLDLILLKLDGLTDRVDRKDCHQHSAPS